MSKKYDYKNFDTREWVARRKKNRLFRVASIFLAIAILVGGFVGVWSTGVIQKAIYNSQDLPDYVAYVDHTHSYTKTVVDPTCTEQGYTLYECRYCDMSYKQDYTATIDHDYQEVVLEQATTTSYGKAELVCSMCGDVKYEITLPLIGHTFTSEVVAPTCTEDGYTIHRSTDTDDMYIDEVIPATGHSMRLRNNYFYCETCGVMEYIEDCVDYGCIWRYDMYVSGDWDESKTTDKDNCFYYDSVEYWYADSNGVLYLAGDQYGASWITWSPDGGAEIADYTKVVYLETAIRATASNLPTTVTEVTFLADYVAGSGGYCIMDFPDGVETVVLDGDYECLSVEGLGIKSLSISGNIEYLEEIDCPSLEELELGEGIENICHKASSSYDWATLNFGKVDVVIFPHSVKYISFYIQTYSRETCELEKEYEEIGDDVAAHAEELEATFNDKPIFVVQEGTTSVAFGYDIIGLYADHYDYSLNDLIIFLPTTIVFVAEDYESCENLTIYYAGDQADLASIVTTTSLLMVSAWKDYVICNTSYVGQ